MNGRRGAETTFAARRPLLGGEVRREKAERRQVSSPSTASANSRDLLAGDFRSGRALATVEPRARVTWAGPPLRTSPPPALESVSRSGVRDERRGRWSSASSVLCATSRWPSLHVGDLGADSAAIARRVSASMSAAGSARGISSAAERPALGPPALVPRRPCYRGPTISAAFSRALASRSAGTRPSSSSASPSALRPRRSTLIRAGRRSTPRDGAGTRTSSAPQRDAEGDQRPIITHVGVTRFPAAAAADLRTGRTRISQDERVEDYRLGSGLSDP